MFVGPVALFIHEAVRSHVQSSVHGYVSLHGCVNYRSNSDCSCEFVLLPVLVQLQAACRHICHVQSSVHGRVDLHDCVNF